MEVGSRIDSDTCKGCGLCVAVCPAAIPHRIVQDAGQAVVELRAERLSTCIACGHCIAICPTRSDSEGDHPCYVAYGFGKGYSAEQRVSLALYRSLDVGDSIQVRYLPRDPNLSRLEV